MRCPVCRKGKVFKNSNPYDIKHVGDMYDACEICNQNFRPEPGFYFGAAVVSYPLTVIFNLICALFFYFIVGDIFDHVLPLLITLLIASLIVLPLSFRYSRIIWLHIVFRYRKNY
jgi:hypothetical protein